MATVVDHGASIRIVGRQISREDDRRTVFLDLESVHINGCWAAYR